MLLARTYAVLGRWDQAAAAYEQAASLSPKNPQLRIEGVLPVEFRKETLDAADGLIGAGIA